MIKSYLLDIYSRGYCRLRQIFNQKETKVNYLYGSTNYQESLQSPLARKLRYRSKQLGWSDSEDDFNNQEESSFLLSEMVHDFNSPKNSDDFNRNTTKARIALKSFQTELEQLTQSNRESSEWLQSTIDQLKQQN
ncbi:hypothetical protein CONCODRAFT_19346 [Conidiobolus coronatus NRRL 28638]|uniref:Uncharacterized protein n=1 Tax=Conidiobolus coronatus (strain ATCC 28846 / CBS 209.66 / NRRL 28638) TaxID=796925 RepID=A0A137NYM5_CONC2|nr:hypothetical protein CONCODRAFT_19346 [Conidiobolus coronatus NRRL 28638]|eukprot:KXN67857.1 hypothetical protein CONCODRAFT_19346 [Conidiobolus coronatus NRRL 28638]